MSCLAFNFAFPAPPSLFITPPLVPNLPLPIDFTFCCAFQIPDILGLNAAIAILNASIGALGGEANAIIAVASAEVLAAAAPLLDLAISVKLECPLQ
jgi:hypothetical protein